jgi:ADP-ribose pyrophosphatase YjhB (NUDIX family)
VVARARGEQVVVIVPTRRAPDGSRVLALPKGHVDPGETPLQAAEREVREETGVVRRARTRAGRGALLVPARRAHDLQVGHLLPVQLRWRATSPTTTTRSRRPAGSAEEAQTALSHAAEREMVVRALAYLAPKTDSLRGRAGAQLLFDDLRRRAQARPQDGDDPPRRQVGKYRKNQAVLVTIGYQYSPRERIFER